MKLYFESSLTRSRRMQYEATEYATTHERAPALPTAPLPIPLLPKKPKGNRTAATTSRKCLFSYTIYVYVYIRADVRDNLPHSNTPVLLSLRSCSCLQKSAIWQKAKPFDPTTAQLQALCLPPTQPIANVSHPFNHPYR